METHSRGGHRGARAQPFSVRSGSRHDRIRVNCRGVLEFQDSSSGQGRQQCSSVLLVCWGNESIAMLSLGTGVQPGEPAKSVFERAWEMLLDESGLASDHLAAARAAR